MNACPDRVGALLEAEPDELAGRADSDLARHIAGCDACREAAASLRRATLSLDRVLASPGAGPDMDALLSRARHRETTVVRRAFPRALWIGLAAAASFAALLLLGPDRRPTPVAPVAATSVRELPTVESAGDADLAVLPTDNPNITVIWFF
jgi:anti-sigma factor RsiW